MRSIAVGGVLIALLGLCSTPASADGWAVGGSGLVIRSTDGGQNWSASSPTPGTLNGVHFVSESLGWAVGNSGVVLKTDDGGESWTASAPAAQNLNAVFFIDADRGWIVGDAGRVLRTTNGGTSWTTSTPTSNALYGVYFVSQNTGWAVGTGVVLRTTNGGASWTVSAPSALILRDVHFVNASVGWIVGSNGRVLKSTNGGASWSTTTQTASDLYSVHMASSTRGWAVGERGSIIRTTNGSDWTEQRPVTGVLRSVFFIDDVNGWAVGDNGTVLITSNGGAEWDVTNPAVLVLNAVHFASLTSEISVTVTTTPPGRTFSVDGVDYTSAQTFTWERGEPHTIATTSPQAGTAGTRYVWSAWSDGGTMSHEVTPEASGTYTADFTTQHFLTMQVAANGTTTPPSGWFNAGTAVQITATPDPGFGFNGWVGTGSGSYSGENNPASVTLLAPITQTPSFSNEVSVTVRSAQAGLAFVVDGTTYTSQQTFTWTPGASHTLEAVTPQNESADTRQVFSRWSDDGAATHPVSPVSNTTFTVTYKSQHVLTTSAGTGGTVTPPTGWYDAGASVQITAQADSGYSFQSWTGSGSGSYTGSANPRTITIGGPVTQNATFRVGTSSAPPGTLTLQQNAPNPATTTTDLRFGLSQDANVQIDVYDVAGRRVFSDVANGLSRGWHTYTLDVTGNLSRVPSGIYFIRISTTREATTGRMVILR